MTRKEFLKSSAAALTAGVLAPTGQAAGRDASRAFKVCVFADLHYHPGRFPNDTPAFLEQIQARAEAAGCDMVIHLGDLVHNVATPLTREYIRRYNEFRIPSYNILGNHDQDNTRWQETVEAFRMPKSYYSFDKGGFRFVCMDPNYFCEKKGEFVHYELHNYFKKGVSLAWIPPEQLEWLRETIERSPYPCVVLSHQSFERWGGVQNRDEVRKVFTDANARHPGRVRLVMNGHYHVDYLRILDGIPYWDVNSANYQWYGETHAAYPEDYFKSHVEAKHCLAWDKPLSAILTLHPDGRTEIEGSEAGWLYGVTPEKAKMWKVDGGKRLILPRMQSASFRIG